MICGRTPEELLREIADFHGFVAPGLLIGAYMVDLAYRKLDKNQESAAIVETRHCLPDAVQLFTHCTIGNGWLKVLDLDKFALTLYDRHTSRGHRIWLDLDKTPAFPVIHRWFMGLVPKKDLSNDLLIRDIIKAGHQIISISEVAVTKYGNREKKGEVRICQNCHEAYSAVQGKDLCLSCQGKGYYDTMTPSLSETTSPKK